MKVVRLITLSIMGAIQLMKQSKSLKHGISDFIYTGYDAATWFSDDIHPDARGYSFIARKWSEAFRVTAGSP